MSISIIAALSQNRVIGVGNQLPWHLSADLRHFKTLTLGKPVIMGRKTFDSIGKALHGRRNIVISSQSHLKSSGCEIFHSFEKALAAVKTENEVMIIGGASLYKIALPLAEKMYLTLIDYEFEGDTFFPQWVSSQWSEISNEFFPADEKNPYDYQFVIMSRIKL